MIQPGQTPDLAFNVIVVERDNERKLPFRNLISKPTVVSVHFKNSSSSCDNQHNSLITNHTEIHAAGFKIVTLSQDSPATIKKYAAKKDIGYALVSDPDEKFARATDSIVEKNMYGKTYMAPARIAVLFDANAVVLDVIAEVTAKDFGPEILARIKKLAR